MGAIFTSNIIVHRLTDYIWLGHSRAIDDDRALNLARIFYSLQLAMRRLDDYYSGPLISPTAHTDRFFPLARSYTSENQVVHFRYLRPLKGKDPSCVTFLAAPTNSDFEDSLDSDNGIECDQKLLVIKFVERYGEVAHRALADKGLAPRLLYFGPVWKDGSERNGCGPRKMVVMEYIDGETLLEKYDDDVVPGTVHQALQTALGVLHDENQVHGDLRRPNIMIEKGQGDEGKRVKILDFDWSGAEGSVRYPLDLSTAVNWPEGVQDYELITTAHDRAMLEGL